MKLLISATTIGLLGSAALTTPAVQNKVQTTIEAFANKETANKDNSQRFYSNHYQNDGHAIGYNLSAKAEDTFKVMKEGGKVFDLEGEVLSEVLANSALKDKFREGNYASAMKAFDAELKAKKEKTISDHIKDLKENPDKIKKADLEINAEKAKIKKQDEKIKTKKSEMDKESNAAKKAGFKTELGVLVAEREKFATERDERSKDKKALIAAEPKIRKQIERKKLRFIRFLLADHNCATGFGSILDNTGNVFRGH